MSSSNQSNETPVISSTPPSTPEPWRAPATAAPWAAGKTPEEILNIAGPAMDMLEKFNLSGRVLAQPSINQTPGYAQPQPQPGYGQPATGYGQQPVPGQQDPNDYPTWGQLQTYFQQQAQQQVAPQFNTIYENQAASNLYTLRGQPQYKMVFEKYGPEFQTEVARLPPAVRTLDNLQMVADLVRGRHVDEIARERAAELAATTPPTMRPNGFAGAAGQTPPDNTLGLHAESVPAAWRERAVAAGITDQVVREWCAANGQTEQQFYEMLNKSRVVTDNMKVTERRDETGRITARETTHFGG